MRTFLLSSPLFQHKLESIGGQDIVDGNGTLILGLIWTIILRFQVSLGHVVQPQ